MSDKIKKILKESGYDFNYQIEESHVYSLMEQAYNLDRPTPAVEAKTAEEEKVPEVKDLADAAWQGFNSRLGTDKDGAYFHGFYDGSNWQEQKQADTISRLEDRVKDLEGYLTISNTSREFNKNKADGLSEALRKILRTSSKSDCDLIAKEVLTPTNKDTQNS